MTEFVTIGVYGWGADAFFAALQSSRVDLLVDIRRRRGVRGSEYAFANSARLQERLAELGIRYLHRIDLSPSDAVRKQQHAVDEEEHVARRQRTELGEAFKQAYQEEVLESFDSHEFVSGFGRETQIAALLCVEREPAACHRELLAARLEQDLGVKVTHLTP
jgi:uncharacterized protein (DUF488 family)